MSLNLVNMSWTGVWSSCFSFLKHTILQGDKLRRRDDWANWLLPSTPVPFPAAAATSVNPGKQDGDHAEKPEQTVAGSADRRAGGSVGDATKSEDVATESKDGATENKNSVTECKADATEGKGGASETKEVTTPESKEVAVTDTEPSAEGGEVGAADIQMATKGGMDILVKHLGSDA